MPAIFSVVLDDLTFTWPDGSTALAGITATFGAGRTGLIGSNGTGKSTLLRLVAGQLRPTSGTITTTGAVDYLPQTITLDATASLADLLGVRARVDAVRAIESGDVDAAWFDLVGDDWDIAERSVAALAEAGLPTGLDRAVGTLSGGETMLAALVGVRLRGRPVALLDEPTNNLDASGRERVAELVRGWRGALVVVSHDLALLELLDATAELTAGALTTYGGGYSSYAAVVAAEQQAAEQALRTAEQALRVERRQRAKEEEKIAHAQRQGRKDRANARYVPAAINMRRNAAEKSAGSRRGMLDDRVAAAREAVDHAQDRVRDDERIRLDLPALVVPSGRRIATLTGTDGTAVVIAGPERVGLTGPNGVGKTTLVEQLVRGTAPVAGAASARAHTTRIGYLPQRLDGLDDSASALANLAAVAPGIGDGELRSRLARFLLRGDAALRPVGTLSGGERFRVALARLMLADPASELLVLDEPTNNLDLRSVEQLVDALRAWPGALLVVSHDRGFLDRLDLDAEVVLGTAGQLTRPPT